MNLEPLVDTLLRELNVYGTCYKTLHYLANGGSDDWFYGEQVTNRKLMRLHLSVAVDSGCPLLK